MFRSKLRAASFFLCLCLFRRSWSNQMVSSAFRKLPSDDISYRVLWCIMKYYVLCIHIYIYTYVNTYTHVCVYVCIYIYTCIECGPPPHHPSSLPVSEAHAPLCQWLARGPLARLAHPFCPARWEKVHGWFTQLAQSEVKSMGIW